mmetsp:Transcript_38740/g.62528  ORF Transcript_38740/g.62528 Transcript_38740/m.62528 type:complete len:149 (+) Transcript_38740:1408-1854(+)
MATLDDCKSKCVKEASCKGIEHSSAGRCEVWTRDIQATAPLSGYSCFSFTASATTTTTSSFTSPSPCIAAWGKCGGNGWDGPTCCVTGYSCVRESQWYSQCVLPSLIDKSPSLADNSPGGGEAHSHVGRRRRRTGGGMSGSLLPDGSV